MRFTGRSALRRKPLGSSIIRIRLMLEDEYRGKLSGTVEMDETFIGGKLEEHAQIEEAQGNRA